MVVAAIVAEVIFAQVFVATPSQYAYAAVSIGAATAGMAFWSPAGI